MTQEVAQNGGCHCGVLRVEFRSTKPLAPRACDCSFCRKHGIRSVSDADGRALIHIAAGSEPIRYRFGLKTADFLICDVCGVCVAALIEIEGQTYSVLNLNAFDDPHLDIEAVSMSYEGESVPDRIQRRRRVWTPTSVVS